MKKFTTCPNAVAEVEPEPAISGAVREGNGKCGATHAADKPRAGNLAGACGEEILCAACAEKSGNRRAFYRLLYEIRGERVCDACGREFKVGFTPARQPPRAVSETEAPASTINDFPELQPGDVLLYRSRSLIGWAIRFRTWSDVEHVEVYVGEGRSVASRNGVGVGKYPLRVAGLVRVFRPVAPVDAAAGLRWFASVDGLPYAWRDLLRFYGWALDSARGMICSQFADAFLNACGVTLFNRQYPDGAVTPRDFEITPGLKEIWRAA